jgi:hypothetical protein
MKSLKLKQDSDKGYVIMHAFIFRPLIRNRDEDESNDEKEDDDDDSHIKKEEG